MPRIREDWFEAEQLIRAAQDGDLLAVQKLAASGFDVNLMDELSKAALHYSVEGEHYKVAQWLVENGADVNLRDDEMIGETALSLGAQGDYPESLSFSSSMGQTQTLLAGCSKRPALERTSGTMPKGRRSLG